MIAIIDYGVGNLGSVRNMLKRAGLHSEIADSEAQIAAADRIVLPGVGAFDRAIQRLNASGLRAVLDHKAQVEKVPILGICLGMQLLTHGSEEGEEPGLGYIDARAYRFPPSDSLKVPHMGWNQVSKSQPSALTDSLPDDARFYFVHSYYVRVADEKNSLLKCHYGLEFDAAITAGNIHGAQFHPEKSHRFGRELFTGFGAL